ncbi:hypothetical protein DYBT9275_00496 [Dyadobacter sp. CECT 9275]|uniref:Secretion system C-terminal sorting domain-containing protein n=1 Tax=Dyadobacter helix TaxID=2822344 RepID=A0A916JBQ9_9BACT|nr:T9SS type A sorting domain-containing protein [Dyadobacter sp. CECT 9275]CAG4990288.1 hypothetical protein DYBT9275_00496 [Dyadobacter sp. CECT 9275]
MTNLNQMILKNYLLFMLTAFAITAHAQDWTEEIKIVAETQLPGDYFGKAVSISGNYAVVAFRGKQVTELEGAGAVNVYKKISGEWTLVKTLTAPTPAAGDDFGSSVAIQGDYIVVGCGGQDVDETNTVTDTDEGAAYLYKKDAGDDWGLIKTLVASTPIQGAAFGTAVAIDGDYIVVGAPIETVEAGRDGSGAAYIFFKNQGTTDSWGFAQKITAGDNWQMGANFGAGLAISGNFILAGAGRENVDETNTAGAVYAFEKDGSTWTPGPRITSQNPWPDGSFGYTVSISGSHAAIGAGAEANNLGHVYLYNTGSWDTPILVLSDPSPFQTGLFGFSVSLSGNNLAVAQGFYSPSVPEPMLLVGAIHIYNKDYTGADNWGLVKSITPSDAAAMEVFPVAGGVVIDGSQLIAGHSFNSWDRDAEDTFTNPKGAAFIFRDMDALPVTLASFEATKSEGQALLRWTTAAETNTDYFEIQRSANGKRWNMLGRVAAVKESTSLQPYSFTDKTPYQGQNLYRLKMVDQDGTFTYSRMQSVSFGESLELTTFPNPVSDKLFFTPGTEEQISSVEITDLSGKIMLTTDKISDKGISIDNLHGGLYIVRLTKKDEAVISKKIVVSR